jgi:hypothetical protein
MLTIYRTIFAILSAILLTACNDKSIVTVYDKTVTKRPIPCLSLRIIPDDPKIRNTLERLYPFKEGCKQRLEVTYKSQIVCNSPYNAPQKTLSNFPTSYLNMEIRRGFSLQYSYYIDLDHKPGAEDIEKGFERMKRDLTFVP